jgi:hypothetical protein
VPHHRVIFDDAIEDAAVAVRRQLPLERQLEITELVDGDDVAGLTDAGQRAVDRLPPAGQRLLPISADCAAAIAAAAMAAAPRSTVNIVRRLIVLSANRAQGSTGSP